MTMKICLSASMLCVLAALATTPASAGDGRTGAFVGGAALGAVGGVLLGKALADRPEPPPPAPAPVYEPAPVAYDPYLDRLHRLHEDCDDGSKRACVQFGEMIGAHRERVAAWRRAHPDYFEWDN
ncbi:hypothetical protein [Labrys neptuniae]